MSLKRKIFGSFLIVAGIAIALTPFTPGSFLSVIGADMVFRDHPRWKKMKERVKGFFRRAD